MHTVLLLTFHRHYLLINYVNFISSHHMWHDIGAFPGCCLFYVFSSLVKSSHFICMVASIKKSGFLLIVLSIQGDVEGFNSETKNRGKEKWCQNCDPLFPSLHLYFYPLKCMRRAMQVF